MRQGWCESGVVRRERKGSHEQKEARVSLKAPGMGENRQNSGGMKPEAWKAAHNGNASTHLETQKNAIP